MTSGPGTEKIGCEQNEATWPTFWSCQCLCRRQRVYLFAARCLSQYCPCSVSISSTMGVPCFVFCQRVPYFSVNFAERLPCTWLRRVMMAATATDLLTPKCSREKYLLSLFLASDHFTNKLCPKCFYAAALFFFAQETTFGFVHTHEKN